MSDIEDLNARQDLESRINRDIQLRTQIHMANVARIKAAQDAAAVVEADTIRKRVYLAQGDSWFDYPLTGNGFPFQDTDIIAQLRRFGSNPPTVLNLAHHGDAAIDEMSLPKQERMITALRNKDNWIGGKPDGILFSAGGNDIAGDQFCVFLDFNDGHSPGLNAYRFEKALGLVQACYLAMFALRDRHAPGVQVYGHAYDFPVPNGEHPSCAGPWLKPSLDFNNWSVAQGTKIVKTALTEFRNMLAKLANDPENRFTLIETQGTLKPEDWANELHPGVLGFGKMAKKFYGALTSSADT